MTADGGIGMVVRHCVWALVGLLALMGCVQVGGPVAQAPEHHRARGFANQNGAIGAGPLEFVVDRARLALGVGGPGAVQALSAAQAAEAWADLEGRDGVQWLGHASVRLRLGGQVYLVDPVLADRVSPVEGVGPRRLSAAPVPIGDLEGADMVLITHNHFDHLQKGVVDALHHSSQVPCLVPLGVGEDLNCVSGRFDWGLSQHDGPVRLTFLPAQHESGRGLWDRNKTLWGSWLLSHGRQRVYLSGDTGYGPHFAEIGRAGTVDFAVLNAGGYCPQNVNRNVHMCPEEAIRAANDLGARRVLMVHWGTYPLGLEGAAETRDRLSAAAQAAGWPPGRLILMPIGAAVAL